MVTDSNIDLKLKIIFMFLLGICVYLIFMTGVIYYSLKQAFVLYNAKFDLLKHLCGNNKIKNGITNSKKNGKKNGKTKHEKNKMKDEIENTCIRNISKTMSPFLKRIIGNYYWLLHIFIMTSCGTILLFDNNIYHLLILFNITCIDCIACVFLHDCPLTVLENHYLNQSIVEDKSSILKNGNILYHCDHRYEKTIEFLTNVVSFITGKISFLLVMKLLHLRT
jgi:hypothetical protein